MLLHAFSLVLLILLSHKRIFYYLILRALPLAIFLQGEIILHNFFSTEDVTFADIQGSDNPIPLSPQWLISKAVDNKVRILCVVK